jgi:DNA-binding transcriptional MerR regulator
MSSETFFNLSEAVEVTGLSAPTLRKYLAEGRLPNAKQTLKGRVKVWAIPLTDLAAAGLMGSVITEATALSGNELALAEAEASGERLGRLLAENEQLKARLAEYRERILFTERAYQMQLETKQAQEERKLFSFLRSKPKEKPILRDRPEWDSSTD